MPRKKSRKKGSRSLRRNRRGTSGAGGPVSAELVADGIAIGKTVVNAYDAAKGPGRSLRDRAESAGDAVVESVKTDKVVRVSGALGIGLRLAKAWGPTRRILRRAKNKYVGA